MPGRLSYEFVKEQIENKGYTLLSTEYKNMKTLLDIKCDKGHLISKTYENIMRGNCSTCSGQKPLTIDYVKEEALKRGFTVLSNEIINSRTKIEVKCQNNHISYKTWNNMCITNNGCFDCKTNKKSEEMSRHILETYYNKPFYSVRPDWLKNPETNRNLELDGYNNELKIAFEYNGKQHYEPVKYWGGEETYNKLVKTDLIKKEMCEKLGIKLLIIPYKYKYTNKEKLEEYIMLLINERTNL